MRDMNIETADKIFKYLFKQEQKGKCFFVQTSNGMVLVDCARIDGAFGIIEGQNEWVGSRVACANRLALMGADLDKISEASSSLILNKSVFPTG